MAMTPRDVIKGNLNFTKPDRIGLAFDRKRLSDFCGAGIDTSLIWKKRMWVENNKQFYDDAWGNLWYRIEGMSSGGEVHTPVLDTWDKLATYKLPELDKPELYVKTKERFANAGDKYRLASLPGFPFAICRYMRKLETYLGDLVLERENIDILHDRVTTLLEKVIKRMAEAGADGIFYCEDWGTQERLLVSPDMWREIFKPLYKRLCKAAHDNGLHVLMHSCGYNWLILDDLAEVGVNAFQFDQPELYGIEKLAEKLQKLHVCLYSPVDIQKTMQTKDKTKIVAAANKMVDNFFGPNGGLIAKNYGDLKGIGITEEVDMWAYETFLARCQGLKK
ncbi:MAG: uroporphyrinogen decarboxylase family protein [Elusimicrobiota bacterium]